MTVRDLLTKMSSAEMTQWMGFYKVEHMEAEQRRAAAAARGGRSYL